MLTILPISTMFRQVPLVPPEMLALLAMLETQGQTELLVLLEILEILARMVWLVMLERLVMPELKAGRAV
jgi:hypothetical protein